MPRPNDKDWEFLDRLITLMIDIQEASDRIEDVTDNLDVLRLAHLQRLNARTVQLSAIKYRRRLERLKEIEREKKNDDVLDS